MVRLAVLLIAAHALADFALQPDGMARRKHRLGFQLLHAAIHAALAYAVLQAWTCWQAPLLVLILHFLIDLAKRAVGGEQDTAKVFAADQVAHVLSLFALAWLLVRLSWLPAFSGIGYPLLVALGGFVATIWGAGMLVSRVAQRLVAENKLELNGLRHGGRLIGQLERSLIFLFIFIGQPAGIGFLVAAKSILRFEEAKKQDLAEYVLIGTLLSFSLAVALASATRWAMAR